MQHNDLFMYYFPAVSHCIHTHIGLLNKSGEFKLEQSISTQRSRLATFDKMGYNFKSETIAPFERY